MARRTYTETEKAAALDLYAEHGPTAVQDQMGIPKGTVTGWARTNGVRTRAIENASARIQAQHARWEERRLEFAHRIGAAAEAALTRVEAGLADTMTAKDAALTMAILVDKAQLLTGAATTRTETITTTPIDTEVQALAAELGMTPTLEPVGGQ